MSSPLLRLRGLVKRFGGLLVTDQVDLDIAQGEIHAVIGPNGAGKTTLINQIAGELRSDEGTIELLGQNVTQWSVARRAHLGLGRSYQINSVIGSFSTVENVLLAVQSGPRGGGHNFRFWKPATARGPLIERVDEILQMLGLGAERNRPAAVLSYGQQRLIELAMALATEPRHRFVEQQHAGLGPVETERMIELLKRLQPHYAMLLVEHDMHAVFSLATRVSVLVYGRVLICDVPAVVRTSESVREAYLGDEEIGA
ncbi:MAG: ABC transporter ATP-binding protein [Betaproteobacteria bacterium]|nr:ABC transporter ATP-binding protein [Betaproteobacteria bacterium]